MGGVFSSGPEEVDAAVDLEAALDPAEETPHQAPRGKAPSKVLTRQGDRADVDVVIGRGAAAQDDEEDENAALSDYSERDAGFNLDEEDTMVLVPSSPRRPFAMETLAIHGDACVEDGEIGDIAPPIHVSTTFREGGQQFVYSRADQPTRARVERVLGELDGGRALTYASGLAALQALLGALQPKCIMVSVGYHGSASVLARYVRNSGGAARVVEVVSASAAHVDLSEADLILIEMPRNCTCECFDLHEWVESTHAAGAVVAVDATFATPLSFRPIVQANADIVLHSASKFLGGHSDVLAGVLTFARDDLHGRFFRERVLDGSALGSLESWLLLRSLRTLAVRMQRHSESATTLAQWLDSHPRVARVWHPCLEHHPTHEIWKRDFKLAPACFAFEMESEAEARALPSKCRIISSATSLGSCESLIEWRAKWNDGSSRRLLRLSVGLENVGDLIHDLSEAITAVSYV